MGMDLSVYEVRRTDKNEIGQEVSPYPLAPDQVEHYKSLFGDLVYYEEDVDIEELLKKHYPEYQSAYLLGWNLLDTPDIPMYIEVQEEPETEKKPEVTKKLYFTSEQVAEFVSGCYRINLASNSLYCKEHVYIRKPFRKNMCVDLSEVVGDTLILRSNNFSGTDKSATLTLMGETASEYCMFFAGKEKLDVIKQLAQLSNDPEYWQKNIVERIENEENLYLAINW